MIFRISDQNTNQLVRYACFCATKNGAELASRYEIKRGVRSIYKNAFIYFRNTFFDSPYAFSITLPDKILYAEEVPSEKRKKILDEIYNTDTMLIDEVTD